MNPFIENSRKCQLIYDRKRIGGYLRERQGQEREGLINKGHEETLGEERYVHSLGCGDGFTGIDTCQNFTVQVQLIMYQIYLDKVVFKVSTGVSV